jgi:hypothetical protein
MKSDENENTQSSNTNNSTTTPRPKPPKPEEAIKSGDKGKEAKDNSSSN